MFLDFVHRLIFLRNAVFRKVDLFPSSGKMMGAPTLFGPLERASLNYYAPLKRRWTSTWLHSATSQKTLNIIFAAVRTWNLTDCVMFLTLSTHVWNTVNSITEHTCGNWEEYFVGTTIWKLIFWRHTLSTFHAWCLALITPRTVQWSREHDAAAVVTSHHGTRCQEQADTAL
jgi:hypothetical protein